MATPQQLRPIRLTPTLQEMVPSLRQALEQGVAHEQSIEEALREQRHENQQIRKALQLFDPDYLARTQPKRTAKAMPSHVGIKRSGGTASGFGTTIESCKPYVEAILKATDNGKADKIVTQKQIYQPLGGDQTKCSAVFKYLRSIEFLAKAGRDSETRRERWRVLDPQAYDRALKALDEQED